jgi:mannose-6-phosphate isomerase-like protein (cupin superfamily)
MGEHMSERKRIRDMSEAERAGYHAAAEAKVHTFKYEKPAAIDRPKQLAWLVKGELQQVVVQVVKDGGENNLHYHTSMDESWMVLKGRAIFWGDGDKVLGAFGPHEGIFIPAGARYRFAKDGPEDLEILQVTAHDTTAPVQENRMNVAPTKAWMKEDIFKSDDPSLARD